MVKARPWKQLGSVDVLNHPRVHLTEDIVELPDGTTTTYLRHAPGKAHSVAVIAVNDKQELLLQKEYSYPPDVIMWQLPGGRMEQREDVLVAANRELSEESGVVGDTCREIGFYYVDNRRSDAKQHVVLCTDLQQRARQRDPEEFIESHWIPIPTLRPMIARGEFSNVFLLAALSIYFAQTALVDL